jgi:hypothetical protein
MEEEEEGKISRAKATLKDDVCRKSVSVEIFRFF